MAEERKIRVEIKSSLNLPPPKVIEHDLEDLRETLSRCREAIVRNEVSIEKQKEDRKELLNLVENPGIYNPVACQEAADRCEKHIAMFQALNKKERSKASQLKKMIGVLERRLCLSEQIYQSTGNPPRGS